VKAELPQAASSGAISSISTETPFSRALKAAQVAAFPAPTTMMSRSAMSISCLPTFPTPAQSPGSSPERAIVAQHPTLSVLLRR